MISASKIGDASEAVENNDLDTCRRNAYILMPELKEVSCFGYSNIRQLVQSIM